MTQKELVIKHEEKIFFIFSQLPIGLKYLLESNMLLRERIDHHPEKSAYEHIKIVLARAIEIGEVDLIMVALFHDITKFIDHTINLKTGYPTSKGHDLHGALIVSLNREFIKSHYADPDCVEWVCSQHMRAKTIDEMKKKKQEDLRNHKYWKTLEKFLIIDNMLYDFEINLSF